VLAVKEVALMASFNVEELAVEKPSHRVRCDDHVNERTVISARGQRVRWLKCSNEEQS
jgi:hypothetical protein